MSTEFQCGSVKNGMSATNGLLLFHNHRYISDLDSILVLYGRTSTRIVKILFVRNTSLIG